MINKSKQAKEMVKGDVILAYHNMVVEQIEVKGDSTLMIVHYEDNSRNLTLNVDSNYILVIK